MNAEQRALQFGCNGNCLVGIIDLPMRPIPRGVLVLAGGPQYRIGQHRQFTLMARTLASRGIPVMRFDHRGMGDSDGETRGIDAIEDDVRAALHEFFLHVPALREVVLWGLGDAATAALLCAASDERIRGLVLLNPWLGSGGRTARLPALLTRFGEGLWQRMANGSAPAALAQPLLERLAGFDGQRLVILSGADPLAQSFAELLARHGNGIRRVTIPGADHAFASREWRDQVADASANWLMSW